ncbi:MAG: D-sedoheptulose 7-phosphate isomerase [Bacteroidales bacterium]|nr:D-sedoheptulose 7-phosphate isomerase [Bacteroidales bacterium]
MDGKRLIDERLRGHIEVMEAFASDASLKESLLKAAEVVTGCFRSGGKVYFCGNGGSAADAQHLAAEFSGKFYIDRDVLPAEALHCNTSYLTAVSNDYSYDIIYSRLISGLGRKGDVLVGISTSGNSANILKAFEVCRQKGITTIAFTGAGGGRMKDMADILINIPSTDTPRIQEGHITAGHILCEMVEKAIFA